LEFNRIQQTSQPTKVKVSQMSQVIPSSPVDRGKVSQEDTRRSLSNARLAWIWKHQTMRETTNHLWTICDILHKKKDKNFIKNIYTVAEQVMDSMKLWDAKWVPSGFRMRSEKSHWVWYFPKRFLTFRQHTHTYSQMNGSFQVLI